jgi:hypothetical protein
MGITLKHREIHPDLDVEGCFGCRVAGVSFGANTTTTRGADVDRINKTDKQWNADMPAYKRLRQQGLHPKSIDGASILEKHATERWQIEGAAKVLSESE